MRTTLFITALAVYTATVTAQTTTVSTSSLTPALASCPVLSSYPSGVSSSTNLFPVHAEPTIATDKFTIQYTNNAKLVTNLQTGEQYLLNLANNTTPATNATFNNVLVSTLTHQMTIPLKKVCVSETTAQTYIELLGERSTIAYDELSYTTSPCIIAAGIQGLIQQYNSSDDTLCQAVWGNANTADADAGGDDSQTISFSVNLETTMLGRAEWIKYVSAFYNKEAAATAIFNAIVQRYNSYKAKALAAAASNPQVVAWIQYSPAYTDPTNSAYDSPAEYLVSTAAYKANLTGDAGATFYQPPSSYSSLSGYSNAIDLFNALQAGGVTTVIDETYAYIYDNNNVAAEAFTNYTTWLSYLNVTETQASQYTFLQNIWRDDKSQTESNLSSGIVGEDDWFESAYPNADAVLADVVSFVQPTANPNYNTIWFRSLNAATPVTVIVDSCPDVSAPRPATLDTQSASEYSSVSCPTYLTSPQSLVATTTAPSTATATTASIVIATILGAVLLL